MKFVGGIFALFQFLKAIYLNLYVDYKTIKALKSEFSYVLAFVSQFN
jgi:hypothetical protein